MVKKKSKCKGKSRAKKKTKKVIRAKPKQKKKTAKTKKKPQKKEKLIGKVTHYFDKIKVAAIRLSAPIKVGDQTQWK